MPRNQPLHKDELPAYHAAARGLLANRFGVKIYSLSIGPAHGGRSRTRLAKLEECCDLNRPRSRKTIRNLEKYILVQLAGEVGRVIRIETNMGWNGPCAGQVRYAGNCWNRIKNCGQRDVDRAFALIVGWLGRVDDGDPNVTLERLWKQANRLLRTNESRSQMDSLAERLKRARKLTGEQVTDLLL
jgi:hypothetical protein